MIVAPNRGLAEDRDKMLKPGGPRADRRHLLHVFASFGLGGVPIRISEVINALPVGFRHTIVALDTCLDARKRVAPHVEATFRNLTLPRYCLPCSLLQIWALLREASPDLLLTYNWGAIECALANRLFAVCDHVHFESGFGSEEADGQLWRRNLIRRFALGRVRKLVVPSRTLMTIASDRWGIPASKLLHIPNGVDVSRFGGQAGKREDGMIVLTRPFDAIIGTAAPLRPEKNVGRLLRAFAALAPRTNCALAIAGDGVQLAQLRSVASMLKIADRTFFLGHVEDVPRFMRAIDIFALSSDTEQMPNSLLQAMAAGRPVAAVDVGDVRHIVAPENRELVVDRDKEGALTAALAALASDPQRRETLGRLNQQRAREQYSLDGMVAAYGALLQAA
jgi:glycosyltransferase involved in cell wall biosynthesis